MALALLQRPLLAPLFAMIAGMAVAGSYGISVPGYFLPLCLLVTAFLIFIKPGIPFTVALYLVLFIWGNSAIQPLLHQQSDQLLLLDRLSGSTLLVEGIIAQRPEIKDDGSRIVIRLEHLFKGTSEIPLHGNILLRIGSGGRQFATGDRVRFMGKLRTPLNYGIPGEFDTERACSLKGIVAMSFVVSGDHVIMIRQGVEAPFQRHFDLTARKAGDFIMSRVPPVEGGILKALLLGDMGDIPQELRDAYSRTGVNHILSISGFHVGILALALFQFWFVVIRIFPALLLHLNFRRSASAASLPLVLYYLFLSGAAPASARSVIMLGLLMAGLLIEREFDHLNTLILAAFALLIYNPAFLYDISFQLSFIALWGIMVLTPLFMSLAPTVANRVLYSLLLFFLASLAAILVTMLPVAFYFKQATVTGLVSNFFIVPLLGYGAVISGFAALPLIGIFPSGASLLLNLAGFLAGVSNSIIAQLDTIPLLPLFVPSRADILIFVLFMFAITVIIGTRRKLTCLAVLPLLMLVVHAPSTGSGAGVLKLDFLSVGQGEATLITFSDGRRMLIDGGGSFQDSGWDVGRRLLLPALKSMGVTRVDYLVLTHPHPDHLQGVRSVADALPVGELWETRFGSPLEDYRALKQIVKSRNIPVKIMDASSLPVELSGVRFRFLHPQSGSVAPFTIADPNENSLVFRIESGAFTALFTGDIGFWGEEKLLKNPELLKSRLLKVPHHGSSYSAFPRFIGAVSPEVALIGAGYGNRFGLPSPGMIDELANVRSAIYRTDLHGTVSIIVPENGKNLVITTLKGHFN